MPAVAAPNGDNVPEAVATPSVPVPLNESVMGMPTCAAAAAAAANRPIISATRGANAAEPRATRAEPTPHGLFWIAFPILSPPAAGIVRSTRGFPPYQIRRRAAANHVRSLEAVHRWAPWARRRLKPAAARIGRPTARRSRKQCEITPSVD